MIISLLTNQFFAWCVAVDVRINRHISECCCVDQYDEGCELVIHFVCLFVCLFRYVHYTFLQEKSKKYFNLFLHHPCDCNSDNHQATSNAVDEAEANSNLFHDVSP